MLEIGDISAQWSHFTFTDAAGVQSLFELSSIYSNTEPYSYSNPPGSTMQNIFAEFVHWCSEAEFTKPVRTPLPSSICSGCCLFLTATDIAMLGCGWPTRQKEGGPQGGEGQVLGSGTTFQADTCAGMLVTDLKHAALECWKYLGYHLSAP